MKIGSPHSREIKGDDGSRCPFFVGPISNSVDFMNLSITVMVRA